MASASGTSSGSSQIQRSGSVSVSGSEQDLVQIMDQRKRKRMISNRESARRSRMRKQKHLDELSTQLSQLRAENGYVLNNVNAVTQMYYQNEADNSVLRAQVDELTHRLNSLNEIIEFVSSSSVGEINGDDFVNPWNLMHVNQPIMASAADMFMF